VIELRLGESEWLSDSVPECCGHVVYRYQHVNKNCRKSHNWISLLSIETADRRVPYQITQGRNRRLTDIILMTSRLENVGGGLTVSIYYLQHWGA